MWSISLIKLLLCSVVFLRHRLWHITKATNHGTYGPDGGFSSAICDCRFRKKWTGTETATNGRRPRTIKDLRIKDRSESPPESEWHTKLVCSALGLGGVGVCPKINWIADIHSGKYFIIICLFNRCGIKRSWWWSYGIARAATPPSHPHHHQSEQRINILNPPMCNLIIQSLCICKLQHKCSVICIRISTVDLLLPILIDREVHKEELINNWWIVGVYKERLIFCFVLQV